MIGRSDLENLVRRESKPGSKVLSVYLNVDQSRMDNLNRKFETTLKDRLSSIEQQLRNENERQELGLNAKRVLSFVSDYKPQARGLVLFCNVSDDFFWQRELNVPLSNRVYWDATPYVRPLVEALDEFERYGVILTDRNRARLFTVFTGNIEEHFETFAPADVHHVRDTGTDHLMSQMNIQRKADEHARWHLKQVADLTTRLVDLHSLDRLILAGPTEATSTLHRLIPKRLRSRVVASIPMPIEANQQHLLEATLRIEEQAERAFELRLVEELLTSAAKENGAVTGLEPTLSALRESRIWRLVYAEGLASRGSQCTSCGVLYAEERHSCGYCDSTVRPVDDLLERMVESVLEAGGRTEQVRGEAAARLREAGGVGAFLRF
jgi:peptide chain release factor subunit 1